MDICSLKDTISARIYGKAVMIEDIIILEYMFSDIKISPLNLFLYSGDIFHEGFTLYKWISLGMRFKTCKNTKKSISSKNAHDVILWREEKL